MHPATRLLQIGHKLEKWQCCQCFIYFLKFSYWSKFHVNIITVSGVMTIFFDWTEIWKSEIPPSNVCPILGDWGKLGTQNLVRMSLVKCYWMLQNAKVTEFTVCELLKENQQEGLNYPPSRLGLRNFIEQINTV